MRNPLNHLPDTLHRLGTFVLWWIVFYFGLWALAWLLHWAEKYSFLPWP